MPIIMSVVSIVDSLLQSAGGIAGQFISTSTKSLSYDASWSVAIWFTIISVVASLVGLIFTGIGIYRLFYIEEE